ncbi:hypothetical protein BO83DRAFT_218637 [Aspergillus eucalypticola CBS 122712]|uniref:Uncharacterized protein n=1 Tax=Aspergillus eucalypticola (strain CBS 122712 / IBT 29274) TaxID=1448314 RepID=A0A317VZG1_ASPEC|nr:uncharacterized protein BO83DRAFT_218637 [Aspergillus eucalypticola CBS 122712]PWY79039.1 hypothetical protein BO83DRAFT_218637 [Aspergillus eucalypticola CBS 122712]
MNAAPPSSIHPAEHILPTASSKCPPTPLSQTSTTLALTTQYPPRPYRGIQNCKRAVLSLYDHIYPHPDNTTSQYLSYNNITPASFHSLRRFRHHLEIHVRFTYFPDISTVLIKVQTPMTRRL